MGAFPRDLEDWGFKQLPMLDSFTMGKLRDTKESLGVGYDCVFFPIAVSCVVHYSSSTNVVVLANTDADSLQTLLNADVLGQSCFS